MLVIYHKEGFHMGTYWVGQSIRLAQAKDAIMVQANGDELKRILEDIPSLDTKQNAQRFYGEDAVKAALVFVDYN